jgi:hypothetical protein
MEVTYGSKGYAPTTTGSYVTVLTVPAGYCCKVTYFLAVAKGDVTVDARWSNGSTYDFLHSKVKKEGDTTELGGSEGKFLIMMEGETLDIKCSTVNVTFIISYELYIAPTSTIVL